jgi:magnesium transporter
MDAPRSDLQRLGASCHGKAVILDFQDRCEVSIAFDDVRAAILERQFVWLEFSLADLTASRELLQQLQLVDEAAIEAAFADDPANGYARYDRHVHLVLSTFVGSRELEIRRFDVLLGEHFLITLYREPIELLRSLRREYHSDFVQFAKTPSFLLYEIWDHLAQNYLAVQQRLEERVEELQSELRGERVDARIFARLSDLGTDFSRLRRVALPARTVLADLVARRSLFISDTTQRAMSNLVGSLEHILSDLVTDRELLSEAVNLYMSSVAHRTNEVMKRLTVVSIVFLPLTFIVGVYGMNFDYLPELKWQYGYAYFWGLVGVVVVALLSILRRARFW